MAAGRMGIVEDCYGGYDNLLALTDPETGEVNWDGAVGLRDENVSPVALRSDDNVSPFALRSPGWAWDEYRCSFEVDSDDDENRNNDANQSYMEDEDDECDLMCDSCGKPIMWDQRVWVALKDFNLDDFNLRQLKITTSTPRQLWRASPERILHRGTGDASHVCSYMNGLSRGG